MREQPYILVVEDDEANRDLATFILSTHGYLHATAADGAAALKRVAERRPNLILMDLSVPLIDGWEVTRRIRQDSATADVRILAVTAHAMNGSRAKALEAGCDDVLTKPYRPIDLVTAVRRLLGETGDDRGASTPVHS